MSLIYRYNIKTMTRFTIYKKIDVNISISNTGSKMNIKVTVNESVVY